MDPAPTEDDAAPRSRVRRLLEALGGLTILCLLGLATVYPWFRFDPRPEPLPPPLPPQASVAAVPSDLPKQGPMQCGAYSLAMALRCWGREADPASLVAAVSHQAPVEALSGTLPWRIRAQLRLHGLSDRACTAREVPRERRLELLQAHLTLRHPVLFLIESERGLQHYVLALGYGPDGIDLYDPNYEVSPDDPTRTVDANGARPGNRTVPRDVLLDRWERGGAAGLYTWWYVPVAPEATRAGPPGG